MSRTSRDSERIVARWAVDCRAAMEGVARRLTSASGVAEDMAQEATIEALKVARADPERVLNVRRPCGWMCGIVRRRTLRWLERTTRRERLIEKNAFSREVLYVEEDAKWKVERLVEQVLAIAPDVLTPKQLDVVTLGLAGRSDATIAAALNMAEATVRVHRAAAISGFGPQ